MTKSCAVVEECGAIPDIEDREGEVGVHEDCELLDSHYFTRPLCIKLHSMVIYLSSLIYYRIEQTFMLKMRTDGLPFTTPALR